MTAAVTVTVTAPTGGTHVPLGTSVAYTATVSGTGGAPNPASGTVNFVDAANGNAAIGNAGVVAGSATVNVSTVPASGVAHSVVAQFVPSVNSGYSATNSAGVNFFVDKVTPTFTITALPVSPIVDDVAITAVNVGGVTNGSLRLRVTGNWRWDRRLTI